MKWSVRTKLDEEAYKRDGFQCVECGKRTGLEAHHIIEDIEELNNLITLCHGCHKKWHNMAGCFRKGDDPRRNTEVGKTVDKANFALGRLKGRPFYGNQYTKR